MSKARVIVQCRAPNEQDWSNLTSFTIDQRPDVDQEEAERVATKAASREASYWQHNYDRVADHQFRTIAV